MPATLSLHAVTASRGPNVLLSAADLTVAPGNRVGIVGPNGVGKSTLLHVCAGLLPIDSGQVSLSPPTATVGLLGQEPARSSTTVRATLRERTGVAGAEAALEAASESLANGTAGAADRYDQALSSWLALGAADFDARLGAVADDLGLSARLLDQPMGHLSGGEAARTGLASLLLSQYDVFLLDEPTNNLDLEGLARLERWVLELDAPVVLVSHDRTFLDRVVTEVAEIDEFTHELAVFGGGWAAYLAERERARAHAWERFDTYDARRKGLAARAQQQREWAHQGQAKIRRSSNDEPDRNIRQYRKEQTAHLAAKSAQTKRAAERLETVDKPREPWELRLDIPTAERSGDVVASLRAVTVDRGEFRLGPVNLEISFGDRVAISGANGAGKTTLIELILGRVEPAAGDSHLGSGVLVGEVEQVRAQLTGEVTLVRAFSDATGYDVGAARTLLAKFGLVGDHVERPTASLSPGERTRAALALLMANGANLLVLDEPTNHLDLPAIEQLEQALDTFAGTVLLVTHDRTFLNAARITRRLAVDEGRVTELP